MSGGTPPAAKAKHLNRSGSGSSESGSINSQVVRDDRAMHGFNDHESSSGPMLENFPYCPYGTREGEAMLSNNHPTVRIRMRYPALSGDSLNANSGIFRIPRTAIRTTSRSWMKRLFHLWPHTPAFQSANYPIWMQEVRDTGSLPQELRVGIACRNWNGALLHNDFVAIYGAGYFVCCLLDVRDVCFTILT